MLANRVREYSTTIGTGDITLSGALAGHVPFADAFSVGENVIYVVEDGDDYEIGTGTLVAAGTLERTTVEETLVAGTLINRTVDIYLDAWPQTRPNKPCESDWWNGVADGAISDISHEQFHANLPIKPVSSISSITVEDSTGADVLWGDSNYYLKPGLAAAVVRKYGRMWPVPGVPAEGIRIRAVAGFGADWNAVPAGIRQAVLMLATHLYYNRGDTSSEPALKASGAAQLLAPYRGQRL